MTKHEFDGDGICKLCGFDHDDWYYLGFNTDSMANNFCECAEQYLPLQNASDEARKTFALDHFFDK